MKRDERSFIVFVDETGFMMEPIVRRTWAPPGKTPTLKISDPHGKISVTGAMALQRAPIPFSFYFHLRDDNANFKGPSVAAFVTCLRRQLDGPITLLWDDSCIQRARPVRDYREATSTIHVVEFPPYAPEWNPVDQVWSYVKEGRLANYCPPNRAGLRRRVTEEFTRVAGQPGLLKGLFVRAGLPLDDKAERELL